MMRENQIIIFDINNEKSGNILYDDSVKRTSRCSEQWFFRKDVLSFTPEKAKAFSLLFISLQ